MTISGSHFKDSLLIFNSDKILVQSTIAKKLLSNNFFDKTIIEYEGKVHIDRSFRLEALHHKAVMI